MSLEQAMSTIIRAPTTNELPLIAMRDKLVKYRLTSHR